MKIVLDSVTKTFGVNTVIDSVSLTLNSGTVYGFQGINGSGKTMLMRLVAGLIYPTSGTVSVNGAIMKGQNNFPENMGLLIENPSFISGYTGLENLKLLAGIRRKISPLEIEHALERVGLDPRDPRKYRKYSLGMKQRLGIACAIMEHPDLLILDEPVNALDEDGIGLLKQIVKEEKERGALVLLSCHDYESLSSMSDVIFRLIAGKIVKELTKSETGFTEETV